MIKIEEIRKFSKVFDTLENTIKEMEAKKITKEEIDEIIQMLNILENTEKGLRELKDSDKAKKVGDLRKRFERGIECYSDRTPIKDIIANFRRSVNMCTTYIGRRKKSIQNGVCMRLISEVTADMTTLKELKVNNKKDEANKTLDKIKKRVALIQV